MDLFTLDANLRRYQLIDNFESLIWTERFSEIGDFELEVKSTPTTRALLTLGRCLAVNRSNRVMTVEVVEETVSEDDIVMLKVTGRSVEALMEDRGAVYSLDPQFRSYKYYLNGPPGYSARMLFYAHMLTGQADPKDAYPFITSEHLSAELASASYAREPQEHITWLVEPDSLYNALKKLCDVYDLGFKLVRLNEDGKLYFYVFPGWNRTSNQTERQPVVFSSALDNIQNTTALKSNQLIKNVAYCVSSALVKTIYAPGVDPNVSGFQRKVVVINGGDKGEPPNAGPRPIIGPEPDYEVYQQAAQPDYGYPYYPPEPFYGAPPADGGMTGNALWEEEAQNKRNQWLADIDMYQQQWQTQRDQKWSAWFVDDVNKYNRIIQENYAKKQAWLTHHNNEVAAWEAENTRLYNIWIAEIDDDLTQKAMEELTKYKPVNSYDGEVNEYTNLRYGVDYDLGDLVEMRDDDGVQHIRRVTEQIFVHDTNGERAYPTLSETARTT